MITNKKTSTYRDFDLRMNPHPVTGDLSMLSDARSVLQSIRNIVYASAGEFLWEPNIGGDIGALLFELNVPTTKMRMFDKIKNNITRFEPRVELVDLSVVNIADGYGIAIKITFYMLNNPTINSEIITLKRVR
jgi:phage baseplate assembly protein W